MADPGVEVIRALSLHRTVRCVWAGWRFVRRAIECRDVARRHVFQRRRREVTRITGVQRRRIRGLPDDVYTRAGLVFLVEGRIILVEARAVVERDPGQDFPFILQIHAGIQGKVAFHKRKIENYEALIL